MDRRHFLVQGAAALGWAARFARAAEPEPLQIEARDEWAALAGGYANLSLFNGQLPGPVMEARAGDTLRIEFRNSLAEASNLHFHGLHVSPSGNCDNSFVDVMPRDSFLYELPIPADHPSGLFWYHPHMHGSVARQVSRGLAGLIVIRGEFDDLPEVKNTPEVLMVLQDFDVSQNGQLIEPGRMEQMRGREGPLATVNGLLNPVFPIWSGGWVRLRVLNASVSKFYRLKLEEHSLTVVGADGGLLPNPFETEELLIVPGQRYDIFVKGRAAEGRFRLWNLPYNRLGGMAAGAAETLATFAYAGAAAESWTMPETLASVEPLPAGEVRRTFTFGMGMGMFGGGGFTINGRSFSPSRVDTRVRLNTVEDWDLINTSGMDHPFHIHTNAFQVVGADGTAQAAWRDVVLVPAGGRVRIRIAFRDFTGKAMYHCHILDHEDLGMMGVIEMAPPME